MKRWLIAEDVVVETPFFRGRMVVEDVEESGYTTTYTLRSLDAPEFPWIGLPLDD